MMPKTYDFLIKDGLILSGSRTQKADVGIKGEQIATVKAHLSTDEANQVIDASRRYVMPGVIDVHVHPLSVDGLGGSSLTAAYGGTTSVICFAFADRGTNLVDTIRKTLVKQEVVKTYKRYLDTAGLPETF